MGKWIIIFPISLLVGGGDIKIGISHKIFLFLTTLSIVIFITFAFVIVAFINYNFNSYILKLGTEMTSKGSEQLATLLHGYIHELKILSTNKVFQSNDLDLIKAELEYLADKKNPDFEMLFYADTNGDAYTSNKLNANIKDRGYFIDIFDKGEEVSISDPIISRTTGAQIFVIAVSVYNNKKEKVAIIASTITLDKLTEIVNGISFGKSGYAFVFDSAGVIVAHPNKEFIMNKKIDQLDEEGYKGFKDNLTTFFSSKNGLITITNPKKDREQIIFAEISNSNNWKICLSISEKELIAPIYKIINFILIISLISVLFIILFSLILGRLIVKPVKYVSNFFIQMAEGEGDLTKKIINISKDEVGELSHNFNKFITNLANIVKSIRSSTDNLSKIGVDLSSQMTENAAAVNEISANATSIKNR